MQGRCKSPTARGPSGSVRRAAHRSTSQDKTVRVASASPSATTRRKGSASFLSNSLLSRSAPALNSLMMDEAEEGASRKRVRRVPHAAGASAAASDPLERTVTSASETLRTSTVWQAAGNTGIVSLSVCPGKNIQRGRNGKAYARSLKADLMAAKAKVGLTRIVCLLNPSELRTLGVQPPDYAQVAEQLGIELVQYPMIEMAAPTDCRGFDAAIVQPICEELSRGGSVLAHCRGGVGRAGLLACCVILRLGEVRNAEEAITVIRSRRDPRAVESQIQMNFVKKYAAYLGDAGQDGAGLYLEGALPLSCLQGPLRAVLPGVNYSAAGLQRQRSSSSTPTARRNIPPPICVNPERAADQPASSTQRRPQAAAKAKPASPIASRARLPAGAPRGPVELRSPEGKRSSPGRQWVGSPLVKPSSPKARVAASPKGRPPSPLVKPASPKAKPSSPKAKATGSPKLRASGTPKAKPAVSPKLRPGSSPKAKLTSPPKMRFASQGGPASPSTERSSSWGSLRGGVSRGGSFAEAAGSPKPGGVAKKALCAPKIPPPPPAGPGPDEECTMIELDTESETNGSPPPSYKEAAQASATDAAAGGRTAAVETASPPVRPRTSTPEVFVNLDSDSGSERSPS